MYVSSTLLNQAWNKYRKNQHKYGEINEGYTGTESAGAGAGAAFDSFLIVLAVLLFVLELIVMVYGIIIAINCTHCGGERIVHVVLSIAFTFPYVLIMSVFNKCAKSVLKGGPPILDSNYVNNNYSNLSPEYTQYMFGSSTNCSSCNLDKV